MAWKYNKEEITVTQFLYEVKMTRFWWWIIFIALLVH